MFPSEMVILMATAAVRDSGKKLLNSPMDITSEYIGYLYDSLVRRGYLKKTGSREYQLTTMGWEAFFEFLHENRAKAEEIINRMAQLGIDVNQQIDELEREVIEVR